MAELHLTPLMLMKMPHRHHNHFLILLRVEHIDRQELLVMCILNRYLRVRWIQNLDGLVDVLAALV